ncbi:rhodanese-like domain-containing protein 11, chloroplastic [Aristolochia californica]|uniref:rhodanese-like domain-containing protein 11, chloroplastic n=1 Tax=Aristolochia californica TaxID=171875 RepID=UPI0035DE9B73
MEALGLPCVSTSGTFRTLQRTANTKISLGGKCTSYSSSQKIKPCYRTHYSRRSIVSMVVNESEEVEVRQMREMSEARKRWEALIRDEKIKVLTPKEAGYAIQLSNTTLLDVRPSTEYSKARVKGSKWIPIFDVDNRLDAGNISKKTTSFVMGGWWSGVPVLSYNSQFVPKVEELFPKDSDLIVACQKGLRSLAACEQLYNAGYRNLFWVQGGLESAEEGDFVREGSQPFLFAGIGGLSEFLGWTDQQRVAAANEGWSYRLVFSARLAGLVLLADGLFLGAQQIGHYLQDLKSP